jgi:hypothetical protein
MEVGGYGMDRRGHKARQAGLGNCVSTSVLHSADLDPESIGQKRFEAHFRL